MGACVRPLARCEADPLAALPGVDVAAGRAAALQREAFYRRLLGLFHTRYRSADGAFASAWTAGDIDGALRVVHDLRSVAASLGAFGVATAAGTLEQACRHDLGCPDRAAMLEALSRELAPVMAGLDALLPLLATPAPPAPGA